MSNQLMRTGGHIHQQLPLATGRTHHQLVQSADCVHHQLTLIVERDDQPPHVEGRIYSQLQQKAGRVQYQLLLAAGRTHLHAAADGGMILPPTTTMGRGTSSPPVTLGSETSLRQPTRSVQLHHLQPLYVRQGHRGQEGVQEGGEREERATQLHNTVQLYSAAYHDQ